MAAVMIGLCLVVRSWLAAFFVFMDNMMKNKAPKNIAPEILFRQLLETPRPKRKLNIQLFDLDLFVYAMSSHELHECHLLDVENINAAIISKCVYLKNDRAFKSFETVKRLSKPEYESLKNQVFDTLVEISPIFNLIDIPDWLKYLEKGATHPSNYVITQCLGSSCDLVSLPDRVLFKDKPEEWFGIPKKDLLDCHLLAYQVARKIYKDSLFKEKETEEKEFESSVKSAFDRKNQENSGEK